MYAVDASHGELGDAAGVPIHHQLNRSEDRGVIVCFSIVVSKEMEDE